MEVAEHSLRDMRAEYRPKWDSFKALCIWGKDMHTHACSLFIFGDGYNYISPASGNSPSYVPFMFHVNASLSFCPSISISSLIGTRTSGWDAFSWITAGSWSSKLIQRATTWYIQLAHDTSGIHRGKAMFVGSNPHAPTPRSVFRQTPRGKLTGLW